MVNWGILGAILAPNMGGWVSAFTMRGQVKRPDGRAWYQTIKKPTWTPPAWVFGPAWTVLYSGMGYASYLVYAEYGGFTDDAIVPLALYGGQLVLNWTWTPVFFGMHRIGLGLLHMFALDAAAVACTISFFNVSSTSGYLMIPYLAWLSFATCLNYSIWQLNKPVNEKKVNGD
uniref:Peripheral-type benzodiazepine receptor n=1 Tax=Heliothis virescens TaxID=7102 RepID=A0A2A4JSF8_HELVI